MVWSLAGPSSICHAPEAAWNFRAYSASSTSRPVTCRMPSACPRAPLQHERGVSGPPGDAVGTGHLRQEVVRACLAHVVDEHYGNA